MDNKITNQIKESDKSNIPNNVIDISKIEEGIHLYGFVKDEDGNSRVIEDNDYSSKKSFETDLRANGYTVNRVNDNRDMYILDNSDYRSINEITTKIKQIEKDIKEGIALPSDKLVLNTLKDILDKAMKISLTENKLNESNNKLTLYHNTTNENAIKISKEGIIPGLRKDVYGKGSEAEGSGIWCSTKRFYGYGGATITFEIDVDDEALSLQNDTEYMVFRTIKPEEIIDVDLVVSTICCMSNHNTVESDIPKAIQKYGRDKFVKVFKDHQSSFVKPYNMQQFNYLLETGEKYCKGKIQLTESNSSDNQNNIDKYIQENTNSIIGLKELAKKIRVNISTLGRKLNNAKYDYQRNIYKTQQDFYRDVLSEINKRLNKTESKHKIEEKSRNELLAKTKMQTKSRYDRSTAYKGFSIADIDTTSVFTTNSLRVTCRVGNYWDTVEMEDILYWIQLEAEKNKDFQINTKGITAAIMNSIDGMDIKVDCNCRRFCV